MLTLLNIDEPQHKMQLLERESNMTIYSAIEGEQISAMARQDKKSVMKAITALLFQLQDSLNISNKLNEFQVLEIITLLMKQYWYLRMEEIILVFRNAKMGKYGQFYNRLDMSMIFSWFEGFVCSEERSMMFERKEQENRAKEIDTRKLEDVKAVQEAYQKLRADYVQKEKPKVGTTFSKQEQYAMNLQSQLEKLTDQDLMELVEASRNAGRKATAEMAENELLKRKENE